jgi:hypothetical protein
LEVNRCFGGTCRLHLHGWRVSQTRSQNWQAASKQSVEKNGWSSIKYSYILKINVNQIFEASSILFFRYNLCERFFLSLSLSLSLFTNQPVRRDIFHISSNY